MVQKSVRNGFSEGIPDFISGHADFGRVNYHRVGHFFMIQHICDQNCTKMAAGSPFLWLVFICARKQGWNVWFSNKLRTWQVPRTVQFCCKVEQKSVQLQPSRAFCSKSNHVGSKGPLLSNSPSLCGNDTPTSVCAYALAEVFIGALLQNLSFHRLQSVRQASIL